MLGWRQARVVGAVAIASVRSSVQAHDLRGIGAGFPKARAKPASPHMKALESLDDFDVAGGIYAKPEEASLNPSGFDKLHPQKLAEADSRGVILNEFCRGSGAAARAAGTGRRTI